MKQCNNELNDETKMTYEWFVSFEKQGFKTDLSSSLEIFDIIERFRKKQRIKATFMSIPLSLIIFFSISFIEKKVEKRQLDKTYTEYQMTVKNIQDMAIKISESLSFLNWTEKN